MLQVPRFQVLPGVSYPAFSGPHRATGTNTGMPGYLKNTRSSPSSPISGGTFGGAFGGAFGLQEELGLRTLDLAKWRALANPRRRLQVACSIFANGFCDWLGGQARNSLFGRNGCLTSSGEWTFLQGRCVPAVELG